MMTHLQLHYLGDESYDTRTITAIRNVFDVFINCDDLTIFSSAILDCVLCLLKFISTNQGLLNTTTFILQPLYYDLYTTTFILRPLYYDLYTTTFILRSLYYDLYTTTFIQSFHFIYFTPVFAFSSRLTLE